MISPQDLDPLSGTAPARATVAPLDLDLIRRYAGPAPRYTSYPPATQFHADLAALDLNARLAEDNTLEAGPVSLYVHLPFCESLCWYCGCNTVITRRHGAADSYLDLLTRELDLTVARMRPGRSVVQLHLGGGNMALTAAGINSSNTSE